jgi:hypothetical protein
VTRTAPYYAILKLGRLTIQALKGGILITAPTAGGDVGGDFVAGASPDGVTVAWDLFSDPSGSKLAIDGVHVWSGGSASQPTQVALGDASIDQEHGGSMTITRASIAQRVALPSR